MTLPEFHGKQIRLVDLSTHTSGLPETVDDPPVQDPAQPYARYDLDRLFRFAQRAQLTHEPGTKFEYSNVGGALLGQLLARRAGKPYSDLVRERITVPLGMTATDIVPTPGAHVAVGHGEELKPVPPFDAAAFDPAADALREIRCRNHSHVGGSKI
jgi:CubicO group peptidase (beta-lactamase class C family)